MLPINDLRPCGALFCTIEYFVTKYQTNVVTMKTQKYSEGLE